MVTFNRFTLANGLRVLVHEDHATPMAVLNILYDVGARDEDPDKTGFAHLFEHLMFGGSVNIPSYDAPLQRVGGTNNAFTSNDITNYYLTLPSVNIETAFWLESDRMLGLAFSEKSLSVQQNVVSEEFKQRYLNQPYGDFWLKMRPLAYKSHPYQWATIGKELSHIENATMDDVKAFFNKHYNPQNAIMVVAGNISADEVKRLSEKWFAPIPAGLKYIRNIAPEPMQTESRREIIFADVPVNSINIAFHAPARLDKDYHTADLIVDILSGGQSSRLYRSLVKDKELFSHVTAYMTDSIDASLVVVEGKPLPGIGGEEAENALLAELATIKNELLPVEELEKVRNKVESTMEFSKMSILNKAMNLAYYELLGDAYEYNLEPDKYRAITLEDIQRVAGQIFRKENSNTIIYITD